MPSCHAAHETDQRQTDSIQERYKQLGIGTRLVPWTEEDRVILANMGTQWTRDRLTVTALLGLVNIYLVNID